MAKKTKALVNLIREVVKQEVKKQMTDIFINEGKKAVVTKSNSGFDVPDILPKPKEQKTYVKDPVLNNILNERDLNDNDYSELDKWSENKDKLEDLKKYLDTFVLYYKWFVLFDSMYYFHHIHFNSLFVETSRLINQFNVGFNI